MMECKVCHRYSPPDYETGYDADDICSACQKDKDGGMTIDEKLLRSLNEETVIWKILKKKKG